MDKVLAAWLHNPGLIREARNINLQLVKHNKSWDDVDRYLDKIVKEKMIAKATRGFIKKPTRSCPRCGNIMLLSSLNRRERLENPGKKSKWYCCANCKGGGCGLREYNEATIEEIIAKEEKDELT